MKKRRILVMKFSQIKKTIAVTLAATMILAATGCGAKDNKTDSSTSQQTDTNKTENSSTDVTSKETASGEKTKIVVWSFNRHDQEYMNQVVETYNQTNDKGIEVEYIIQTDNFDNMLTMAASSGQSPDIISIDQFRSLDTYKEANLIQPITSFITDTEKTTLDLEKNTIEGINADATETYWMPLCKRSGSRLIYNKELFEKAGISQPPKTLDELVTTAKALTDAGEGVAYGVIFPGQSGPFGRWLETIGELSGVRAYDYATGTFSFDGFKPIVEAAQQMFADNSVFPGSASMKIDPTRTQFAEGNVGMCGNASQEASVLTQQFPAKIEWGVAEVPTIDGQVKGAVSSIISLGWAMSADTKNAEAAWDVIAYFSSEEVVKGYLESGFGIAMSDYMAGKVDMEKIGRLADFMETGDNDAIFPPMPAVTPEGEIYADALWNCILPGGPNIDETIATLNQTYNTALDKAVELGKVKRVVVENYDPMNPSEGAVSYLDK